MSAAQKDPVLSDTEGSERPVREQLKKATIAPQTGNDTSGTTPADEPTAEHIGNGAEATDKHAVGTEAEERGRLRKKRSFDDIEDGKAQEMDTASVGRHGRKRSRDSTAEEAELNGSKKKTSGEYSRTREEDTSVAANGTPKGTTSNNVRAASPAVATSNNVGGQDAEGVVSPKTKRSRVGEKNVEGTKVAPQETAEVTEASGTKDATDTAKSSATKIPPTSGFSNTSATSPFNTLAGSKSPESQPETSSTAFKASGFGALAGSSSSGFGSLGTGNKLSSFASSSVSNNTGDKPQDTKSASGSAFGGALGASSPFASAGKPGFGSGSSFGKLGGSGFGGGFGSAGGFGSGTGSKLTSFASPAGAGVLGSSSKPVRAFGAPADDDEGEGSGDEDDEAQIKSPGWEEEKKDERFFEQEVETGEENETTEFSCRAKLYNFVKTEEKEKGEWKERGLGTLRFNVQNPAEEEADAKPKARFVMRADGSHRLILNTPVKKEIKFGTVTGEAPTGQYVYFMGSIDNKPQLELLQLKMRPQFAMELYQNVTDLQREM